MRFAVLCKGVLRGRGREEACELLATKTVVPEASRAVYSHCAVVEAPLDLPDGDYEVEFAGEIGVVSLHNGLWTVGRLVPHTFSEAASFYAAEDVRVRGEQHPGTGQRRKIRREPQGLPGQPGK